MKTAILSYSRRGTETAGRIARALGKSDCYTVGKFLKPGFSPIPQPSEPFYGALFRDREALIFVGACGIAVRCIAPHVRDKTTDPAVLCVDEQGKFVISLLSGHIGGANALAVRLADLLGAEPVVTTATDRSGRFSVDAWAAEHNCVIDSMPLAKAVSAAILERTLPLSSDFPVVSPCPAGLELGETGELGICISLYDRKPFVQTLRLIPRIVHLGVGCRRGTDAERISQAVENCLAAARIDPRAVRGVYSIDLKQDEAGLLEFCAGKNLPITFYSAAQLNQVEGNFSSSEFVRRITGTDNVCERAALREAGTLLIGKTALDGVTVAAAAEQMEVRFG